MSGNTACTSLGSTCITSTGGKITVRLLLRDQSPEPRLGLLNAYLALSAVRTMLPFNYRLLWDAVRSYMPALAPSYCPVRISRSPPATALF